MFLTEGSLEWGSGHLNRCLSLAQELARKCIPVSWIVRGDEAAEAFAAAQGDGQFLDWCEPGALEGRLDDCFLAIVDSYHSPRRVYDLIADSVPHRVWIDDYGRLDYPPGVALNPNPPASLLSWQNPEAGNRLLSGYMYQSLRSEFLESRPRSVAEEVRRILVLMGGTDSRALTPRIVAAARQNFPSAHIDAIVPDDERREALAREAGPACSLHGRLGAAEVKELMEASDLAILAAGQTLCEACRTGLPAIAVCVAENQVKHSESLARAGAVKLAGTYSDEGFWDSLRSSLAELSDPLIRGSLAKAGAALIDGRGARRVIADGLGWSGRLDLRKAKLEDSRDILRISNLPSVRAYSLRDEIITESAHDAWYPAALANPGLLFLAARDEEDDDRVVGQLRYSMDSEARSATVSISLDPSVRGKGEASKLLREGDLRCFAAFGNILHIEAVISPENSASERAFIRAGYLLADKPHEHRGRVFRVFHKEREDV